MVSKALSNRFALIGNLMLIMILIQVANSVLNGTLGYWGIHPRQWPLVYHIFTGPFIHGNWSHLANNLFGLALFGFVISMTSIRYFVSASIFIITVTGLLVFLFARDAVHIGASGWVFGLWALAIAAAVFDRNLKNIVIAFTVVVLYGGMIYGVLPQNNGISFESHLFGALSGVLFAALSAKKRIAHVR